MSYIEKKRFKDIKGGNQKS